MLVRKFLLSFGQNLIGEGETPEEKTAREAAEKETADKAAAGGAGKSYTQDELNNIIKVERKKYEDQIKKQTEANDQLLKSKGLTDQERQRLETHNEQLKNELLTKDELSAKERKRLADSHQTEVQSLKTYGEGWRERFNNAEIARGIADATVQFEAVSLEQMTAQLRPWTSMVEEVDAEGKGTGNHSPRVKFPTVDKDGKPKTLDLTIGETVKIMKESPERFGNMFKSNLVNGLGMGGGTGKRTLQDVAKMSDGDYIAQRRKEDGKTK